jgi:hypothetical protein
MVVPLETHPFGFLTAPGQARKVFTLRGVPHDFLSPDARYGSPAKGAALSWVWGPQELGPNGCRNLDCSERS